MRVVRQRNGWSRSVLHRRQRQARQARRGRMMDLVFIGIYLVTVLVLAVLSVAVFGDDL